jgi:hypothetical protein
MNTFYETGGCVAAELPYLVPDADVKGCSQHEAHQKKERDRADVEKTGMAMIDRVRDLRANHGSLP